MNNTKTDSRRRLRRDLPSSEGAAAVDDLPTATVELRPDQKASIRVLVIDDEESICESCLTVLRHEGFDVSASMRGSEAEDILQRRGADIVLLDLYMSGVSGRKLLRTALETNAAALVIVMTGRPSVESAIQALREGAWDYIPKPFSGTHLQVLVGRAAHTVVVARESREQDEADEEKAAPLGDSPAFRAVIGLARKVATTDASVFITGESGTGKEMVAQFIHQASRRKSRRLVALNCAALPETLLESEMFGHVKGAFTGATRDKAGLMEVASGGTLFLDEITEMAPTTQAKLLRVVQDGVVRRVGSTGVEPVVNVRFISATNRDPLEAVEEGKLREDLFYRLGVVPIHIPPLRERPEDIPILVRHFLSSYWERHRGADAPVPSLTPAATRHLQERPWKGNVRELQNVIEHAIVLAEWRDQIDVSDIPHHHQPGGSASQLPRNGIQFGPWLAAGGYHAAREEVIARFEKDYLSWVLQETDGNVSEAARVAGVNRATLYRLLEKHELTKGEVLSD
jgi:DNA-binding NtrC family response regulator